MIRRRTPLGRPRVRVAAVSGLLAAGVLTAVTACTGGTGGDQPSGDRAAQVVGINACRPTTPSSSGTPSSSTTPSNSGTQSNPGSPSNPGVPAGSSVSAGAALPSGSVAAGKPLPDLRLPCFERPGQVRLAGLTGPAVVNLWASWCPPCRAELPAFQHLAERTPGQLTVVGVVSGDRPDSAGSLITDLKLGYPMLDDPDGQFGRQLDRGSVLPVTLFVDANGHVVHQLYIREPLNDTTLSQAVRQYLGVAVN